MPSTKLKLSRVCAIGQPALVLNEALRSPLICGRELLLQWTFLSLPTIYYAPGKNFYGLF